MQERRQADLERQSEQTAVLCATIFNAARTDKKQKVWTVDDFLNRPKKLRKVDSLPASLAKFKSSARVKPKPKATTNGKPG